MQITAVAIILVLFLVIPLSQIHAEEISVKEWDIPTANSAPHDIVVDKTGIVWFTEINTNKIGKFDPKTEQFTEYPIPTPSSLPHGLVADNEGNVWFTEVGAGKIGKLNSITGNIEEFETPTKNSGPHTPILAKDDTLWFTEQSASKIGRLDIKTGQITEFSTITPAANPYGIIVDNENNAWFAELQGDHIGKVDAITGQVTEYAPITSDSGPRRIAIDSEGILWFTEFNSGKIASFNPNTEEMIEYDTSSESSGPYAIWVDLYDNVWFSMTGIYRVGKFDQSTQMLHEYDLPSPQTHIKFIHTDDKGNVWFPNYNNNKIGVIMATIQVTIKDQTMSGSNMDKDDTPTQTSSGAKGLAYFPPPLKQIRDGVEPTHVTCTEGLELVLKFSTGQPACIKPSSVSKLIERGWAIHVLPDYEKSENNNSVIFSLGEFKVDTMDVSYYKNSKGYLAKPNIDGKYPAVIMIHEFWGLNDNIKEMAEKLASHGYVVLAVDLYDGKVGATSDEARQLRSSFDPQQWIENMNTASAYIQEKYQPEKIGSIGWCFGGGQSLNLALNNENMDATVIYYGQLVTEKETLSKINWPILGIFAGLDQGILPETVNEFETVLDELEIQNDIYIYPDVNHAFANPSGDRYAPDESMDAWEKTLEFFKENLK